MAVTSVQYTISGPTDKTHAYGVIEMPPDGLSIVDSDLLVVSINGSTLTLNTDYTVDSVAENVIIDASYTVAATDILVIERETGIDSPYVDFTNNTTVDAEEVDLALLQLRFKLQELESDLSDLITYNVSGDYWDGKSRKTQNFEPATALSGLVTLGQLQAELSGTQTATVEEVNYAVRSGDNSTTTFALPDFPITDVNNESFLVFIDGVKQKPTVDFTVSVPGTGQLTVTFLTAPNTGSNNVEFMTYKGVVQTGLDSGTLDGDAIIDQTVSPDAIDDEGAAANSYLKTDGAGSNSWDILTHSDITNWDSAIGNTKLNTLSPPDNIVDCGSQILDNVGTPTADDHGATKSYVDSAVSSVATNYAGTTSFMEPYDTDSSGSFSSGTTSTSITGLPNGVYFVNVTLAGGGAYVRAAVVNGISRSWKTASSAAATYIVTVSDGTISASVSGGSTYIENITGFRIA